MSRCVEGIWTQTCGTGEQQGEVPQCVVIFSLTIPCLSPLLQVNNCRHYTMLSILFSGYTVHLG